jgi:hypothetical protein
MGSGAFGWLAFGWYSLPLADEGEGVELDGVGGDVLGTPQPGGALYALRPGGALSAVRPGGGVSLKPYGEED